MYLLLPAVRTVIPQSLPPGKSWQWKKNFLQEFQGDILINQKTGRIEKIAKQIIPPARCEILEAHREKIVLPGFIDAHVHFRSPGNELAENWRSGSLAALFAGITCVLDMPNTMPPTVDAPSLLAKEKMVEENSLIHYGIFMGVTTHNMPQVFTDPHAIAFKIYLGSSTGNLLMQNIKNLTDALPQNKSPLICFHAEKESIIQENVKKFGALKNVALHSQIRSPQAAIEATQEILNYAQLHNVNFHVCHVSTPQEMQMLSQSSLSWEAAPHHIFCSTENYRQGEFLWKCNPPLRDKELQKQMYNFLLQEKIPMIATDHAPHKLEDKSGKEKEPASGVPSLQVGTHFILQEVFKNNISLPYAAWILSAAAALRFGLGERGFMCEGYAADLAVIDARKQWKFESSQVLSQCAWTPFENFSFLGKVEATMVGGRIYNTQDLFTLKNEKEFLAAKKNAQVSWLKPY